MNYNQLSKKFAATRVLVIGDVMLDKYVYGDVDRISPEAPVPVVKVNKEEYRLGGAANVAANLKSLGADVTLCGATGNDNLRGIFLNLLIYEGITRDHIYIGWHQSKTICKTRIISNKHQICRLDSESDKKNYQLDNACIRDIVKNTSFDAIIFSDYNKGTLTNEFVLGVMKFAEENDIFTALSPKPNGLHLKFGNDLITMNLKECNEQVGGSSLDVLDRLSDMTNARNIVVTMGENGMMFGDSKNLINSINCIKKDVIDVSGAGDTVLAALVLCLVNKMKLKDACEFANKAASVVVSKFGTSTVTMKEIEKVKVNG